MSRLNSRESKARRRAERERQRRSATSGDEPRAVEVRTVQAALRPAGSGPRNADEHGSGRRSDAGGSIAVELDEADLDADADLESADPGDFAGLDADDAGLQAALTVLAVLGDDIDEISDVAELPGDLVGDVGDVGELDVPGGPEDLEDPETDQPSADADVDADPEAEAEVPDVASARGRALPEADGEDDEIVVLGDDDDDLPAARVAIAGATADPVKDYLKQIGKVSLLNAAQEVDLAKRIEAGLLAEEKLAESGDNLPGDVRVDLEWVAEDGRRAKDHLLEANLRLVVSLAKRYTGRGMLFLDLIQEGNLGIGRAH